MLVFCHPRHPDQCKGDCRGSNSAKGHLYYIEPLKKSVRGETKRFKLRWRKKHLEEKTAMPKDVVKATKTKKAVKVEKGEQVEA